MKGRSVNFAWWVPIFVIAVVLSLGAIVHVATHPTPYMPKWAWIGFIVLTMPLGAIVYVIVGVLGAGVQRPDAEGRNGEF